MIVAGSMIGSGLFIVSADISRQVGSAGWLLDPPTHAERCGNLYSSLPDYAVFAKLPFYVLAVPGIFVLRRKWPEAERPYRAFGYPVLPALCLTGASIIMVVLFFNKTQTAWPGRLFVLAGVPVYFWWRPRGIGGG